MRLRILALLAIATAIGCASSDRSKPPPVSEEGAGGSAGAGGGNLGGASGKGGKGGTGGASGGSAGTGGAEDAGEGGMAGAAGAPQCLTFNPDKVYLLGNISPGDGRDAIAELDHPDQPCILLETHDEWMTTIRPDGRVVWKHWNDDLLWLYTPDAFKWNDATKYASYPDDPMANDDAVPTPGCDGADGGSAAHDFLVNPDDNSVVYVCSTDFAWFDSQGAMVAPADTELISIGHGGFKLARSTSKSSHPVVLDPQGAELPIASFPIGLDIRGVRVRSDGFWVAAWLSPKFSLFHVDHAGNATVVGDYADAPAGLTSSESKVRLDADGNAYHFGNDADAGHAGVVIMRPLLPGTSSVVYTESGLPDNNFEVYPPKAVVRIHISGLISGP